MRRTQSHVAAIVLALTLAAGGACGKGDGYTAPTTTTAACTTGAACNAGAKDPHALIGTTAPAVTGRNLTGSGDLSLSAFAGKPTAVVFWLNTCPHCQHDMPEINALQASMGDSVNIVAVAIDAGMKGGKGFETPAAAAKTLKLTVPTILEARSKTDSDWHLAFVPTAFILDAQQKVVAVVTTDSKGTDITPGVRRALQSLQ